VIHFFNETSVKQSIYLFLYYIFLVLGKTVESLLDGRVSRLPCKDVPNFLEEFDERGFLFGVQSVSYVRNLGRLLRGQWDCLAE
jgi:hypothetical protein